MDYERFFSTRLAQLRMDADVSARDMSLSMGQSPGYINKIESQQNLPSMTNFFYICEYFGITPKDFFDENIAHPENMHTIMKKLSSLSLTQLHAIEALIDVMN